jgi:hypothetical protein
MLSRKLAGRSPEGAESAETTINAEIAVIAEG